eukprot:352485-Chlamydomonas_euryale.AAC.5
MPCTPLPLSAALSCPRASSASTCCGTGERHDMAVVHADWAASHSGQQQSAGEFCVMRVDCWGTAEVLIQGLDSGFESRAWIQGFNPGFRFRVRIQREAAGRHWGVATRAVAHAEAAAV